MDQIQFPNRHTMPALGLGTWDLRGSECLSAVKEALHLCYRHIDTAEMYANEAEIGRALKGSGVPRSELFITTKVWTNHHRAADFKKAAEASLGRLGLAAVDLLLIHWPNPAVPLAETVGALCQLVREGKALSIGVSNFPPALLKEAIALATVPIVCDQVSYCLTENRKDLLTYARSQGVALCAYTPLGKGAFLDRPELKEVSQKYGKTPAQVALRWLIQQKGVAAIPKASGAKHMKENIDIFDFKLDPLDRQLLSKLQA
jgi:diketogulonate reductase-like aldo/keto reductase